jgi:hypothetical protein
MVNKKGAKKLAPFFYYNKGEGLRRMCIFYSHFELKTLAGAGGSYRRRTPSCAQLLLIIRNQNTLHTRWYYLRKQVIMI